MILNSREMSAYSDLPRHFNCSLQAALLVNRGFVALTGLLKGVWSLRGLDRVSSRIIEFTWNNEISIQKGNLLN
jgi:hypothetical protein